VKNFHKEERRKKQFDFFIRKISEQPSFLPL